MKNKLKAAAAAVTALAMFGCTPPAVRAKLINAPLKALAAGEMIWEDEDHISGVLKLSGQVTKGDISTAISLYGTAISAVVAEESAVLPEDCSWMFATHSRGAYDMPPDWEPSAIDLTQADTSNVKNMRGMFYGCYASKLDLRNFITSNVTDMSCMFEECLVTKLDLSSFDTSKVTDMKCMFDNCYQLTKLNVGSLNTSNVTNMGGMFGNCSKLTALDLSGFDTSNVLYMSESSGEMPLIEGDDDIETDHYGMFENCKMLKTIYVSDRWNMDSVVESDEMFYNCLNLTGGSGTAYSSEHTGGDYAHIDGGADNPGYLTFGGSTVKGASLSLDGRIGLNFYVRLSSDAAKAVLEGPLGTVTVPRSEFAGLTVQDGDYAGCTKLTYGINATQRLNKVTLKLYDSDGNLLDICNRSSGLMSKQLSYSAADYISSYRDTGNENLTNLVTALERYFKSAENHFMGKTHTIFPEGYTHRWFDIYNSTDGDYALSLILNSGTDLRIYTDAAEVKLQTGFDEYETLTAETTPDGKRYFAITDIPAQDIVGSERIYVDGREHLVCPRDWCVLAVAEDKPQTVQDLGWALYEYGKAAETYLHSL